MSTAEVYDNIVIGAGIQGSFTAYHLVKKKQKTLLLEQFALPHTRGSSHGQTRIIRKTYDQDFYTHMMDECYKLWAQLEREASVKLYRQTGLLVMGPENSKSYCSYKSTLEKNKIPMVVLTPENFNQHITNVILADGDGAFVDTTAGVLYADRALKVVQGQFQKLGGVIKDHEKVIDIKTGQIVTVSTFAGVYQAKGLVITAGPWTNKLLAHIDLHLPLEICYHNGSKTDPDQRDMQTGRADVDILRRYIARCFKGLIPEPSLVENCMYTFTPDHHFVLDRHPGYGNIVIGAGFSGHGFKFGPVIGKLLCELSLGEVPSYDLSPFRVSRFQSKILSSL
ncbi:peroxisomal sarcosine oxidase isoform X2 [Stigmatopora argus]